VTGSTSTRSLPGPFLACVAYALRVCVPPKRWAILALPSGAAVLFGVLARLIEDETREDAFGLVATTLVFALVVPFACLVVGDAVLGAERRSGAFALTWLSPTPVRTIVLARWIAGWLLASIALAPAVALAAIVAAVPAAIGPIILAVVSAAGAYIALFMFIGATFARSSLVSLVIVFLVERLLGAVLAGVAQLSPQWLGQSVYAGYGPSADDLVRDGVPSGAGAIVRLAVLTAVFLVLAERRVRKLKIVTGGD
jgi:ABC-type transport system involved in multi-copper enzyme maturation permease subunit